MAEDNSLRSAQHITGNFFGFSQLVVDPSTAFHYNVSRYSSTRAYTTASAAVVDPYVVTPSIFLRNEKSISGCESCGGVKKINKSP